MNSPKVIEGFRSESTFNTTEELIAEFRAGRMVVLIDDEDRENEGDLVMPAQLVTPEAINFMARYARGLICLPITRERYEQLSLWLMANDNTEAQGTKFTVSIDAARGITTGISAADRATTIAAAVAKDAKPSDFVQPGHVFPLVSEPGGVLTRAGHTEAGCDLARLAGLESAAVVVEILNEDGTMARRPDLEIFSKQHHLKIGTIADLIQYRTLNEQTVRRESECELSTRHGKFTLRAYREEYSDAVHFALSKGDVAADTPTLIRVHVQDSLSDLTGSTHPDAGWPISDALQRIGKEGGVVLILRHPEQGDRILNRIANYQLTAEGNEVLHPEPTDDLRTYGVGAQILSDLGVRKMRVLSAPKNIRGLSGFGLEVVEYVN